MEKLTEFSLWGSDIPLEENLFIDLYSSVLPVKDSPIRMDCGIICLFLEGSAEIEVDCVKYQMEKGMILSVLPMQIIEQKKCSYDLKVMYFTCSITILKRLLFRFPPEFVMFIKEYPTFKLPEAIYLKDLNFVRALKEKMEERDNICRVEIVMSLLRCFFLDMYNSLHHKLLENPTKPLRQKELARMFIGLVMKYFKESREVSFYANQLNITSKYLSMISQEVHGQNAKKSIDEYVATEMKLLLKTTTKSIQEIAEELNFPDQSFFCKYFRKQTGLSPKQYRNG